MKKLILMLLLVSSFRVFSQDPDPPSMPGGHGENGNQQPAGAPIDGGLGILLALGAGYGARKVMRMKRAVRKSGSGLDV
jgi:hypothetical protein